MSHFLSGFCDKYLSYDKMIAHQMPIQEYRGCRVVRAFCFAMHISDPDIFTSGFSLDLNAVHLVILKTA